jgi:hypothetical protein
MKRMTSVDMHEAMRMALEIVDRQIADGTLDQSGRFYTDEELEVQRKELAASKLNKQPKAPAA